MKLKILGVDISVSYTFLCMIALCIILDIFSGFVMCALAVIVHEAGHVFMMNFFGYRPESIKISPFEISIKDNGRAHRRDKENFLIILFGPLNNFICVILLFLLYLCSGLNVLQFMWANISLGLFNLLPVMSLDGGQLIYLLLSRRFDCRVAQRCVNLLTFIAIFPIAVLGFLVLFNSQYNFSLLFVCLYLILSLIFKNNRFY